MPQDLLDHTTESTAGLSAENKSTKLTGRTHKDRANYWIHEDTKRICIYLQEATDRENHQDTD